MVRNVILLVSTLAVLLLLFVGYTSLVGGSGRPDGVAAGAGVSLPATTQVADENRLVIEGVEVGPSEWMGATTYDSSGRPTDSFRCRNWEKVPGTQNELRVVEPELMMRLPSGMIVTVTAARGQIKAERGRAEGLRPRLGWLEGEARIVVDRETSFERTPLSERPEDQITIEMERLEFDLELGELKTSEPLRVTGTEFEIAGTGLHLIWNESDNRVEKLLIERGGQMVLKGELLRSMNGSLDSSGGAGDAPLVTQPARLPAAPVAAKARSQTAYSCAFAGGVTVDHYVGERRLGGLDADELDLLFDVGGRGRGFPRGGGAASSAPSSQPDESPGRRIVVRWGGRLSLGPARRAPGSEHQRRHIEARGRPMTAELPNGTVRCSRLVLHQESQQLWLYPTDGGVVELSSGENLSVSAAEIFVDLEGGVAKLIGPVLFGSGAGRDRNRQPLTIRCDLWGELHLAAARAAAVENVFDNPLASRPPESAVFVGDVEVEYDDQALGCHRLDAHFREVQGDAGPASGPPAAEDGNESPSRSPAMVTLLESAVASGDVRLTVLDPSARRGWRQVLERRVNALKRALAGSLSRSARGKSSGLARYEDRTLRCASLRLDFGLTDGEVYVREMHGSGAVRMFDRRSHFAARGQRVTATFVEREELQQGTVEREELQRATVGGTETAPAFVRARAYALRGKDINVDNQVRTLHIDGPSRLAFRSRRSLQGLTRNRAELITVTSSESMHIDDQRNTVRFIGQVAAGTGNEQLLADKLTLLLEDEAAARPTKLWSRVTDVVRAVRGKLRSESQSAQETPSLLIRTRSRSGVRKELARILAGSAEIRSVVDAVGDPLPLVYQSIAAPELEVDVRRRFVRTSGETTLLMTDRRLPGAAGPARAAEGLPSALISRGPSQTAMKCSRYLIYMMGEEGPERKDSVLLEGRVRFRHVTGREMVDLQQMLPQVVGDPGFLEAHQIRNRNTYMECERFEGAFAMPEESDAPRAALGLRPSLRLSLFNACGHVYLRDQLNDNIRTVYAHQLEYDRTGGVLRVLGMPEEGIEARVYDENPETGRLNIPAMGPEIVIDLETYTVSAKEIRGQAGR